LGDVQDGEDGARDDVNQKEGDDKSRSSGQLGKGSSKVPKFTFDFCTTGRMMKLWKKRVTDACTRCHQSNEDADLQLELLRKKKVQCVPLQHRHHRSGSCRIVPLSLAFSSLQAHVVLMAAYSSSPNSSLISVVRFKGYRGKPSATGVAR
jgi:hypothetical protein